MAHLTRYCMYRTISEHFPEGMTGKILGISGIEGFHPLIDMHRCEVTETAYPAVDMQQLPYGEGVFDCVISDQVIEHVKDPQTAVSESYRVLKQGGTAIHTTCFMNHIHPDPVDLWRFTPDGLRYLCRDFSRIVSCDGWGNRGAIFLCFLSRRLRYMEIPETKWSLRHFIATYNEERVPIVTWIIAKK